MRDDNGTWAFILGGLAGTCARPDFPINVERVEYVTDDDGIIQSFVVVTASGLRYRVEVIQEEEE